LEASAKAQVSEIATATTMQIDTWLKSRLDDVCYWAGDPRNALVLAAEAGQSGGALDAVNQRLEQAANNYKTFQRIHLLDSQGIARASSHEDSRGKLNVRNRDYFQDSIKGKTVISKVLVSKSSGLPVLMLTTPVRDAQNRIKGVMAGVVDLGDFTVQVMSRIKIGETGYAYLLNQEGMAISHQDNENILKLDLGKFEFGREMLSKKKGIIFYDWEGSSKLAAYDTVPSSGWVVVAVVNQDEILSSADRLTWVSTILSIAVLLLAALTVFLIARSVANPINRIVRGMNDGASQVASASDEVSSAGQTLAQLSTEQAASLEETSTSMEEMASMTRQNADNAAQADSHMKETTSIVNQANASMEKLREAMEKINSASDETAKIIRTIDEIAFQTNLLALNAAVEAARAGEAGAGFAVVADEVRNLAMRAAEAARNTQGLIEANLTDIREGTQLVKDTDERFHQVRDSSGKVSELVAEIAAASKDQAMGIDQINKATSEMDKVTQQMAATAEESAASSEELSAMAATMHSMVNELANLVRGGKSANLETAAPRQKRTNNKPTSKLLPAGGGGNTPQPHYGEAGDDFNDF
jgi:methyl-accepting chemotaxis protein